MTHFLTQPGSFLGHVEYNGVRAAGAYDIRASFEPVYSNDGRTVVWTKITIETTLILAGNEGTTVDMTAIRRRLTEPCKALIIDGQGFGLLAVNAPGARADANYGPKPRIISWNTLGREYACSVNWSVETCIKECDAARDFGVSSLTFATSYDYDEEGNVTRTISGELTIAATQNISGEPADTAENYLSFIFPEPPAGFKRTHNRQVSEDKRIISFSIRDAQIASDAPYPNFVTDIDDDHTTGRSRALINKIRNTYSVSMTLAPGVPPEYSWSVFLALARPILAASRLGKEPRALFIDDVRASRKRFRRRYHYSVSWLILGCVEDFLGVSGFWKKVEGTSWHQWKLSMAGSMFAPPGTSGLRGDVGHDVIVDLCRPESPLPASIYANMPEQSGLVIADPFHNQKPDPEKSYLDYKVALIPVRERPVAVQSPIQDEDEQGSDTTPGETSFSYPQNQRQTHPNIIQVGGASKYLYWLVGSAIRVGYEVPRMALNSIGGVPATEIKTESYMEPAGDRYGQPVYKGMWRSLYALAEQPSNVTSPDKFDCGMVHPGDLPP